MLISGSPVTTRSPEETQALGRAFAGQLQRGDCVAMVAPLGGGKTCFVQGVAAGLGATDRVTSPTFILVNEYGGAEGLAVYHFDLYRLKHAEELVDIGWYDYVGGEGICLVEWADRAPRLIPPDAFRLRIDAPDPTTRVFTLTGGPNR